MKLKICFLSLLIKFSQLRTDYKVSQQIKKMISVQTKINSITPLTQIKKKKEKKENEAI